MAAPIRVLDVGQCPPDHATIRNYLGALFPGVQVVPAHDLAEAVAELKNGGYDLVLVNRKLDRDYSDGLEVIRAMKRDPEISAVPVMLVTNYPEHQEAAVAEGAVYGFGKLQFDSPETAAKLRAILA